MKKTGIIESEVTFGMRDMSHPAFWFSVKFDEHYGALIIMNTTDMANLMKKHNIYELKNLKGAPCWLEVDDSNIVTFKDLWK